MATATVLRATRYIHFSTILFFSLPHRPWYHIFIVLKIPGKAVSNPSFRDSTLLTSRLHSLSTFCAQSREILALLLSSLSDSLGLSLDTSLVHLHRVNAPSMDILRLLHYTAQPSSETGAPQAPHTDLGSLTLLFATSPGFQIKPPNSEEWASVRVEAGCAVVNVGDGKISLPKVSVFPA